MRIFCLPVLTLICFFPTRVVTAETAAPTPGDIEFFEQRIRPVLVEQCYECHNTSETSEGGLSLDHRDAFLKGGESGPLIASQPNSSMLLKVLRHQIEGLEMPEGGQKLDNDVIADFEKWIAMGAPDPRDEPPTEEVLAESTSWEAIREKRKQWWSFQPIVRPKIPEAIFENLSNHPIDRFIHAKLAPADLTPTKPADRSILARRLSFALTGLAASPTAVAEFVKDPSDDAYSRYVDRLLQSDRFGERWARHWMDWIRYAESHGSEGDPKIIGAHHYRDYLIRSLNADVPYDQLVREHVAGDLLETPRINDQWEINESQVATAHWRMVFHGFGPTDAMEEKVRFTDDAVNVFSKAFLGITVSCARCHDHKFDPISQADYYAMFGIIGSARPGRTAIDSPELLNRNRHALKTIKSKLRNAISRDWLDLIRNAPESITAELNRAAETNGVVRTLHDADDFPTAWQSLAKMLADSSLPPSVNAIRHWDLSQPNDQKDWFAYGNGTTDQSSPAGSFAIHHQGDAVIRDIFPAGVYSHLISDKHAAVFTSPSFSLDSEHDLWIRVNGGGSAISRFVVQDYPRNGTVFPFTVMKDDNSTGWRWQKYDLSYWKGDDIHIELATANDSAILVQNQDRSWFGIRDAVVVPKGEAINKNEDSWFKAIVQDAGSEPPNTFAQFEALFQQALEGAVGAWQRDEASDAQALLLDYCVEQGMLANTIDMLKNAKQLVEQYRALETEVVVPRRAPALAEWTGKDQPLYERGNHKQPRQVIPRRFLEAFDDAPYQTELSGRRELAENVLSDDNPLTSRVIVNRIWHHLFGRGIVGTNDNFGRLGHTPTHPELLDYLASEFRTTDGWSIKSMIRRIVTSDTWRQDFLVPQKANTIDPGNELYSHWSINRLEAEAIRDAVLSTTGQLNDEMYGAAVAGNSNRRSIYVKVIRNFLDPFLATFDAPVPFSSKGRRDVTNVPAQSLLMMNNPFVLNAAEKFANRALRQTHVDSDQERIAWMWLEAFGRPPSEAESRSAIDFLASALKHYEQFTEEQNRLRVDIERSDAELRSIVATAVQRVEPRPPNGEKANLSPIAEWSFEDTADDAIGDADLKLRGTATIDQGALVIDGDGFANSGPLNQTLREKTLEAVVQLATLDQAAGGVMTVQDLNGNFFDSIVFAEKQKGHWLAGSDYHRRTKSFDGDPETEAAQQSVHLAITYDRDGMITCYRNGQPYGTAYQADLQSFNAKDFEVVFGMRHGKSASGNRMLRGRILHARLFDRALTPNEVQASASGAVKSISPEQIELAMSESERRQRDELQLRLKTLRSKRAASQIKVRANQHWIDLAHSMFNMKEFIYVR